MPPAKALPLDEWEESTQPDAFARLIPYSVAQINARVRAACLEAGSRWARSEALLDEVEEMLK